MIIRISRDTVVDIGDPLVGVRKDLVKVGIMLVNQVKERFATQGRSGSAAWKPKVFDDERAILTGRSGTLLDSFSHVEGKNSTTVFTTVSYARVHQVGTRKYGGPIPTIVPKKAKALFIPLTDRAATSRRISGITALRTKSAMGVFPATMKPYRVATRGKKKQSPKSGQPIFLPLKRGAIVNGQLMVWDSLRKMMVPGKPDFIFLKKVDIPPRPMLPTSNKEIDAQDDFVASMI